MLPTSAVGGRQGDISTDDRRVVIFIRSAIFNVLFYVTFFIVAIAGLPTLLLPRAATMWVVHFWAAASVKLLEVICGTRIEFRNLHLLPKGASLIAVKHQSFLETFAMITVLDDFCYVLKRELLFLPFFGWYALATKMIGVDRKKRAGALPPLQRDVRDRLAAKRQIVIFPEGTRKLIGAPPAYKAGVAAIAAATDVPCTPVALNTGLFWPRHSFRRRPGTVVIEFLPPIQSGLDKADFMDALQGAIEPATKALVATALADDPELACTFAEHVPAAA